MFGIVRALARRVLGAIASKVAGACDDSEQAGTSQLVMLEEDEVLGELPPGTPVVTFSSRAIEMQNAANRLHAERQAHLKAAKPVKPGPRVGSKEWRLAEAKAGR